MKKHLFFWSIVLMCTMLATVSCSDDDGQGPNMYIQHPLLGEIKAATKTYVTVTSENAPMDGQDHRSSNNFSTEDLEDNGALYWFCSDPNAVFDVYIDKTGKDEVFATGLKDGSATEFKSTRNFYIANPSGASSNFTVICMPFSKLDDGVNLSVSVNNSGFKSSPFRLDKSSRYRVLIPSGYGLSFSIRTADKEIATNVEAGDIIDCSWDDVYVTNVVCKSEDYSFADLIQFQPWYDDPAASWMTQLPDDTPIQRLTIPGTHDTGTFDSDIDGSYRCQNFDIMTQLTSGIRFFDIRLQDEMHLCHGSATLGDDFDLTLSDVLIECSRFLTKYPGEVILMCVKDEHGSNVGANFKKTIDGMPEISKIMDTSGKLKTLGELRGKIVLLRRFPNPTDGTYGINLRDIWPDNGTDHKTNSDGVQVYIQDRYYGQFETHNTREKTDLIKTDFSCASGDDYKDYLFIVYSSISFHGICTPYNYAWGGNDVNPRMNESLNTILDGYLKENRNSSYRLGIVPMDYYNNHGYDDPYRLAWKLINTNFKTDYIPIN